MPAELGPRAPETRTGPEVKKPQKFAFVIPGASSTSPGMSMLQAGFEKAYGPKNAHVYNSALFNREPVAANRYTAMKAELEKQLKEKDSVDVFLLSLGAAEMFEALEVVDSLEEYKNKLHFYYISPTAPNSKMESITYLAKYGRVLGQEATALIPGKGRIVRSIMSFATVPPEDFTKHGQEYTNGIRQAALTFSQAGEVAKQDVVELLTDPEVNFLTKESIFKREEKDAITALDAELLTAIRKGDNSQVRRLLMQRYRITRPKLGKIYNGTYTEAMGFERQEKPNIDSTKDGRKVKRKLLADTFWKTEMHDKLDEMAEKGFEMTLVVPEYSFLFNINEANQLAHGRDNVHVKVAALTTHAYPWGVNARQTYGFSGQTPQAE